MDVIIEMTFVIQLILASYLSTLFSRYCEVSNELVVMFAPCFEISSMRVGLDFEIAYSSSKSKKVFRYYHP
jgi:hypothetical protein